MKKDHHFKTSLTAKLDNALNNLAISKNEALLYNSRSSQLQHQDAHLLAQQEQHQHQITIHSSLFHTTEYTPPPQTLAELWNNVQFISGLTVGELAEKHGIPVIDSLQINKGWLGNLIEIALGAVAGSKPTQDFQNLGIELKTVSISKNGKVTNDIFLSSLPINSFMIQNWQYSHLFYKLQFILFIPIEGDPNQDLVDRKIGLGVLWRPKAEDLYKLQEDWNHILQILQSQEYHLLTPDLGQILNIRTKALNSKQFNQVEDEEGFVTRLPPLSFYLKRSFVNSIFLNKRN